MRGVMLTHTEAPKAPWIRSMLPPVLTAACLMFAVTRSYSWYPAVLDPARQAVFHIENGVWRQLPELPGRPEQLRVSGGGAVWVSYWRRGVGTEMARLDGASWRIYTSAELGSHGLSTSRLVMDGEEIWGASYEGALRWDGHHWQYYQGPSGEMASGIAAANGEAWTVNDSGDLRHFDGAQWQSHQLQLAGVNWADEQYDGPQLARTADGTLWIVLGGMQRGGVWRGDGTTWQAVETGGAELRDAALVGTAPNGIWLWDFRELRFLGSGGEIRKYGPAELGLSPGDLVEEAIAVKGRTLLATGRGVLELNGDVWRRLAPMPDGIRWVVSVQARGDGELFAIGRNPSAASRYGWWLVRMAPLTLSLAVLAIPVWMRRAYKRQQLAEHQRLRDAVTHATGATPEEFTRDERLLVKQSSWWSAMVTVGVVVGSMIGYSITRLFWPGAPSWTFLAIALALHLAVTLGESLVRRTPKPWDPIEPGGPGFDWAPTMRALPLSLMVFVLMSAGHFPRWMGDPILWILYAVLAFCVHRMVEIKLVNAAIRRSDFEGALKVVRRLHFFHWDGGTVLLRRGHLLLSAGRFAEAEMALRRAVAALRARKSQAFALEALGDALMEQGRYEEAQRSYEAALHAVPGFDRPYRGMAEMLLRQGREAVRALEYVERLGGTGRRGINRGMIDDYWGLKTWALAELGRGAEVQQAAAEAARVMDTKSRPDVAAVNRRLGLAMRALERDAEAERYLRAARDAGPGRWASLAASRPLSVDCGPF